MLHWPGTFRRVLYWLSYCATAKAFSSLKAIRVQKFCIIQESLPIYCVQLGTTNLVRTKRYQTPGGCFRWLFKVQLVGLEFGLTWFNLTLPLFVFSKHLRLGYIFEQFCLIWEAIGQVQFDWKSGSHFCNFLEVRHLGWSLKRDSVSRLKQKEEVLIPSQIEIQRNFELTDGLRKLGFRSL